MSTRNTTQRRRRIAAIAAGEEASDEELVPTTTQRSRSPARARSKSPAARKAKTPTAAAAARTPARRLDAVVVGSGLSGEPNEFLKSTAAREMASFGLFVASAAGAVALSLLLSPQVRAVVTIAGWELGICQCYTAMLLRFLHCTLIAHSVRMSDAGSVAFAHTKPLASLAGFLMINDGSGSLVAALLGSPMPFLAADAQLGMAVLAWYLVFFSPLDLWYKMQNLTPAWVSLIVVEELARASRLAVAIGATAKVSDSAIAAVLVGSMAGGGSSLLVPVEHCLRTGGSTKSVLIPTFTAKASFVGSVFLVCVSRGLVADTSQDQAILMVGAFMAFVASVVRGFGVPMNPFSGMEDLAWMVGFSAGKKP